MSENENDTRSAEVIANEITDAFERDRIYQDRLFADSEKRDKAHREWISKIERQRTIAMIASEYVAHRGLTIPTAIREAAQTYDAAFANEAEVQS